MRDDWERAVEAAGQWAPEGSRYDWQGEPDEAERRGIALIRRARLRLRRLRERFDA